MADYFPQTNDKSTHNLLICPMRTMDVLVWVSYLWTEGIWIPALYLFFFFFLMVLVIINSHLCLGFPKKKICRYCKLYLTWLLLLLCFILACDRFISGSLDCVSLLSTLWKHVCVYSLWSLPRSSPLFVLHLGLFALCECLQTSLRLCEGYWWII